MDLSFKYKKKRQKYELIFFVLEQEAFLIMIQKLEAIGKRLIDLTI